MVSPARPLVSCRSARLWHCFGSGNLGMVTVEFLDRIDSEMLGIYEHVQCSGGCEQLLTINPML